MAYGILKCDNITFDNGGSDQNVTVSGLYRATTSGVTVSGTIAADTVSGVTVIGSTTVSGDTVTGTTANFTSGNFSNIISSAATMSGALIMANQQQVQFREAVGNGVNHIALQAPAIVSADQTITLPDETGTIVTTGDNGSVTSTMILDGTITNADINASAAIAGTKITPNFGSQTVSTTATFRADRFENSEANDAIILDPSDDSIQFVSNGNEKARIDSFGRLLVGTPTYRSVGSVFTPSNLFYSEGAGDGHYEVLVGVTNRNDNQGPVISLGKSRGTSVGSSTIVQNGDQLGLIRFSGADGTDIQTRAAEILGAVDGTPGSNDMPGRLVFSTTSDGGSSPTERMRIDSSGNVGIGTTSPIGLLNVSSGASVGTISADADELFISNNGNAGMTIGASTNSKCTIAFAEQGVGTERGKIVYDTNDESLQFFAASAVSERARIDSSGRLLVGPAGSTISTGGISGGLQLHNTANANGAQLSIVKFNNDTGAGSLILGKSKSATVSPGTAVVENDSLGNIIFVGDDGTDLGSSGASITAFVDGTPGSNDMPGRLVFSTTSDGNSGPTERMSISNEGYIFPDAPSRARKADLFSTANPGLRVLAGGSATAVRYEGFTDLSATQYHIAFSNPNGIIGSITTNGSATAYNTSSDYRLKENVVPLTGAVDRLKLIPVHRFNFIADPDTTVDGFIAHEAQAVVPECVTGAKDEVDDEGNPVYQGIDQSKLVPLLTAALQEAIARIETLEAAVAALQSA